MSYAAPFSLLSWHLPDHDESVAERLRWPLAGSALLHAVVFVALLSLRFGSSLEQSSGSYEVTLVTLPEIAASSTAAPQRKAVIPPSKAVRTTGSRSPVKARVPERAMDALVSVPKPQATAIPKIVTPPVSTDPRPILKQNVDKLPPPPREDVREVPKPERVTESLVSALDAVIVPKPQTLPLPQESAPVRPSVPAPVKQSPAVEKDVPAFKAPPQPPKLVVRKPAEPPTPAPSVDLLAPKLKQAVGATSVPKKPEQVSKRVSPAVASKRKQKQDAPKAPESPVITLPSRAPRLTAVAPPEMRKKETPLQTGRKSSTMSPAKAAEARNQSLPKPPQAPQLAEFQAPVHSEPTVPKAASEPDTPFRQEIDVSIPDLSAFEPQPVSKQTGSGGEKAQGLWQAGLCSPKHPYWKNVEAKIDKIHGNIYRYHYRVESPAILTFRVKQNGQVEDLDVFQSSGNKKFDLIAKRAVLAAVPLPPFPANMTKPFCQINHKFKIRPNP